MDELFAQTRGIFVNDAMEKHEDAGVEFQHRETLDKKRGRVERRLYWSAAAPAALTASGDWTDLCSIGMVISERTENGKTTREVRYYIMSLENNVQEFSRVVRAHWSIENCDRPMKVDTGTSI